MYVKINGTDYTKIASLTFAPQTSMATDALPINQFVADIITTDDIEIGQWAELRDERYPYSSLSLWAKYWITTAYRINPETVRVIAESELVLLNREKLPAVMYGQYPLKNILQELFPWRTEVDCINMNDMHRYVTISGYLPEQTPRERLAQICLNIGGHVRSYANDLITISARPQTAVLIPFYKTLYRPEIKVQDWVTKTIITEHSYQTGTPSTTDEYVKVGNITYIETTTEHQYNNYDSPSGALTNEVRVDDMTLEVLDYIAPSINDYYFKNRYAEIDVINNHEYFPGDKVIFYLDPETLYSGYIEKCDFRFGLQARCHMKIVMLERVLVQNTATLTVKYQYNGTTVASREIVVPQDITYKYYNPPAFYRVEDSQLAKYTPQSTGMRQITIDQPEITQNEACNRSSMLFT